MARPPDGVRARKYRGSRILAVTTAAGDTRAFARARAKAIGWESALPTHRR